MSLNQLPNELIAHIGSFLKYDDIIQFALSQKRVDVSLKLYGLNKANAESVEFKLYSHFYKGDITEKLECNTLLSKSTEPIVYNATYGDQRKFGSYTLKMIDFINKFSSISNLKIYGIFVHDAVEWGTIKTKLGHLTSDETFKMLCKKFRAITLYSFFTELTQNGTIVCFRKNCDVYSRHEVSVTDTTLDTLSNESLQVEFAFDTLGTEFSFRRVKKMIEAAVTSEITEITWDFGFLKEDPYLEITHFCKDQFQEWADALQLALLIKEVPKDVYDEDILNYDQYVIHRQGMGKECYYIKLAVIMPDHLFIEDEDMDDEDSEAGEEDPMDG